MLFNKIKNLCHSATLTSSSKSGGVTEGGDYDLLSSTACI